MTLKKKFNAFPTDWQWRNVTCLRIKSSTKRVNISPSAQACFQYKLKWRWCFREASQRGRPSLRLVPPEAPAEQQLPASSESSGWACSHWSPCPSRCGTRRELQLFCPQRWSGPKGQRSWLYKMLKNCSWLLFFFLLCNKGTVIWINCKKNNVTVITIKMG